MHLKTIILSSASAAVIAIGASPAWAQADPATPVDPTVQAQTSPADPDAGSPQTDDAVAGEEEAIVVTGLRRSLQSAQNLKRNSDQQIDAIVAEDIGKLPDITVSDTAARLPGIQVERSGGEASRVLLRGLDEDFYTTTYNAREIFTAETRSVALQDFPAGAVAALEAYKTSTANLVEPGLAGLINVRSRRPFDFDGFEIAGSVWAHYPLQSREASPNGNLLITNRWNDTAAGDFGALINFSYTQLKFQDSTRRHGFFIADLAGGRSPDWPEISYNEGNRWRPSINGTLQWRPSPGLELYVEGLWQGYREHEKDRMFAQPLWGGSSYENLVFRDGTNQIVSGTVNNPGGPYEAWGFQGAGKRKTDTFQFAIGGSYDAGPLRITGDVARTSSKFNLRTESIDYEINNEDYSVDWFTGEVGGSGPTYQVIGLDTSDPSNYNYRGFFEDYLTAKGKDLQARLDFEYESGLEFLPRIQFGVRYVDRDASADGGSFYWNYTGRNCCGTMRPNGAPGVPISAVPLDYQLFEPAFHGDNHKPFPTTWYAPTFSSVWDNLRQLRQFNIDLTGQGSLDGPADDPARSFNINEKSLAGYAQLNYNIAAGDVIIDGTVGVRVVRTKDTIDGTVPAPGGPEPVTIKNKYTDWLPNANMRIQFSPEWQLRLAATQTRTRPTFQQLNPGLRLSQASGCSVGASDCVRTGSGGNPFLTPLDSNNYDISLEYYFSRNGFASLAGFRRDMKGFVTNRAFQFSEPDPETGLPLLITGPVNTNKARIQGIEAQVSTFFDFDFVPDWARAFGIQANATYIDAKAEFNIFPETDPAPGQQSLNEAFFKARIPDVSKWTYNLVGMYEAGGVTARLALNHRTGYPEGALAERDGFFTLQGRAHGRSRVDWSSSYTVNEHLTVFFDWLDIFDNPFKSDIVRVNWPAGNPSTPEVFPMLVRYEESLLSGGIRFRF